MIIFSVILSFIYAISIKYNLKIFKRNISNIIILYYFIKLLVYDIQFKFIPLIILGIIIGSIWMYIFSKILRYPFKFKYLNLNLKFSLIIQIIIEEITWRGTLERYCIINGIHILNVIICILFIGVMFAYSHNLKKELQYKIEFYLFALALTISFFIFMNISITIGMHLCRNNFILNASKEYE